MFICNLLHFISEPSLLPLVIHLILMHGRILFMPIDGFLICRLNPNSIELFVNFLLALFLSFSHGLNCFSLLVHLVEKDFQS
jgi:hypothetical protein